MFHYMMAYYTILLFLRAPVKFRTRFKNVIFLK